jgi:mono/diheme cytochrome c family protein
VGPLVRRWAAAIAAFAAVFPAASIVARGQSAEVRSIRDGIFSAAQVNRGRESFLWVCTECHEMEEFTAAGAYLEEMDGKTLWEVFEYIWSEMPEDNPSWLEPEEYADVLAYILSVYGMPAGAQDMPTDEAALEQIRIAPPSLPGS